MTQAPTEDRSHSPLLQHLGKLGLLGNASGARSLAELLGDQIDLSDSITLASALASLDRAKVPASRSLERPERQFLNARGGMIRLIANSFEPGEGKVPYSLPAAEEATLRDPVEGVKPFLRFYSLLQSEMDHRSANLRRSLRSVLGEGPQARVRLAVLDRIVDDILGEYSRGVLAVIPKLLNLHFQTLRSAYLKDGEAEQDATPTSWAKPGGWLHRFNGDMRQTLLAELDVRLMPARALLDAMDIQDPS